MATGHYLLDHPNPRGDHFYRTRRGSILAFVVHITAGLEDLDGHADQSAEATASYAASTDREVSWHSGSDSDSSLDLLPHTFTAFHAAGYNSRTYGHEISKTSPDWRSTPAAWVEATLGHAAARLGPRARALGVPFRLATRAELDDAIRRGGPPVGFIGHHSLDPSRRRDPGLVAGLDTFPWRRFFDLCGQPPAVPPSVPSRPSTPSGGPRVAVSASLPVLRAGSNGKHVAALQALLNVKAGQGLANDGTFGPATDRAVRNWQAYFRLGVDGIVGGVTWKTLLELPL